MLTNDVRPCESGQHANPQPQAAAGSQIPAARNIKQTNGWLWQEKAALRLLAEAYSGDRLRAARSVYLALTEIASNQFTLARAHTSCAYLGHLAGLGENAVRRYLHEFTTLGLIAVEAGVHQANTYLLLAGDQPIESEAALTNGEMKLADAGGVSHARVYPADGIPAGRGTSQHPPEPRSAPLRSQLIAARGTRSGTQDSRIPQNKKEIQTNRGGGAEIATGDTQREAIPITTNGTTVLLIASPSPADEAEPDTQFSAFSPQSPALAALTSLGVRREVAAQIAAACDERQVLGWVSYAKRAAGLKSRAGFVLAMLRQGQAPPQTDGTLLQRYPASSPSTPPEPAQRLTEASPKEGTTLSPAAEAMRPPPARDRAIWHTAKEELLAEVHGGAKLWLQNVRLITSQADHIVLSSPPLVSANQHTTSYGEHIAAMLGAMLGRVVTVEFQAGW